MSARANVLAEIVPPFRLRVAIESEEEFAPVTAICCPRMMDVASRVPSPMRKDPVAENPGEPSRKTCPIKRVLTIASNVLETVPPLVRSIVATAALIPLPLIPTVMAARLEFVPAVPRILRVGFTRF